MAATAGQCNASIELALNSPRVGVVVVNHDGGERVLRVLAALQRQPYPLDEIVVVDNASTDGSAGRIREAYPRVRVIELEGNLGVASARNVGLEALTTPLALLIDHDVYVEADCIERLVRAQETHGASVVCPRIRLLPESGVVQADGAALHFLGTQILRHSYERADRAPADAGTVNSCIGACMLVDRARVIEAGGFDELFFFYFEDLEFSMRMRSVGNLFWCDPGAVVFHERGDGTPGLSFRGRGAYPPTRAYFTMRNRLLSMLIHYRARTLVLLSPVLLLHEFASLALAYRMGCSSQWLHSWGWLISNSRTIGDRRRRAQRLRKLNDRELLEGGIPPLAPNLLQSRVEERLFSWYSAVVNRYWSAAKSWIG